MTATIEFGKPGIDPAELSSIQARIDLGLDYKEPDAPTTAARVRQARDTLLTQEGHTPTKEIYSSIRYGLSEFTQLGGQACEQVAAEIIEAGAGYRIDTESTIIPLEITAQARARIAGMLTRAALSEHSALDEVQRGLLFTTRRVGLPLMPGSAHEDYEQGMATQ